MDREEFEKIRLELKELYRDVDVSMKKIEKLNRKMDEGIKNE